MTETLSRVVAYSKLESKESADDENGIECGVISSRDAAGHFSIDDTSTAENETEQVESASVRKGKHHGLEVASVSHLMGRPDLASIIKTAFESAQDAETDIGIFMCGPSSLTTAVSQAITNEERCGRCLEITSSHESRAYVYQEMFEL